MCWPQSQYPANYCPLIWLLCLWSLCYQTEKTKWHTKFLHSLHKKMLIKHTYSNKRSAKVPFQYSLFSHFVQWQPGYWMRLGTTWDSFASPGEKQTHYIQTLAPEEHHSSPSHSPVLPYIIPFSHALLQLCRGLGQVDGELHPLEQVLDQ